MKGLIILDTYLVYFDETGDDGITTASSDVFVLTSMYIKIEDWQKNFNIIKNYRKRLKQEFGFPISEELHTKHLVRDKGLYRPYNWSNEQRVKILSIFTQCVAKLDVKIINVIIDKNNIKTSDYSVLKNALTYNIQRIENDSDNKWHYLVITDKGRLAPMRKTAREIRAYNPISSHFGGYTNSPIKCLVEDIMEKDSSESYFIQMCDFISFFANLYYKTIDKGEILPKRVERVISREHLVKFFEYLNAKCKLNLRASPGHKHGFVIYPK